ncbi:MAG: hypothetical protein LQ344_005665 [Seirophora lacunosa]|nr:MAG: hypothetical protein LQ344_005665 [Seirophora lacunosa]
MLVSSPKEIWNCRSLSIHLPPLGEGRNSSAKNVYSSPPMSASPKHSRFVDSSSYHQSYKQQYTPSPTTQATSGKQSPLLTKSVKSRPPSSRGEPSTASSNADIDTARTSLQFANDSLPLREGSADSASPPQDFAEAHQLSAGVPGVARRAKAHVPCLQTGKEATCVDVQHKKRGRPRLREEETLREVAFGIDAHPEAYASQSGMIPLTEAGRPRSKSYRELRSQPDHFFSGPRPRTSDAGYGNQYSHAAGRGPMSPMASYVADSTPTVLLTPDFRVAQHNYAFADALAIQSSLKNFALLDLVVPSDRDKIYRVQTALRAEMLDSAHLPPMHGRFDPGTSMPYIGELNIAQATAGFQTRSEYWSFRLPGDRSRGFPISISLARGPGHFIIMTLVHSIASNALSSPHGSSHVSSPTASHPLRSPTLDQYHMHGQHANGSSRHYAAQLPITVSQAAADRTLLSHSHGLSQYRQASPPQLSPAIPYGHSRTNSGSEIPRSSPASYSENPRDSLRHLQLPPIRTSPSDIQTSKPSEPRRGSSGKGTPVRGSPQSGRKKKRRRVEIGDILH